MTIYTCYIYNINLLYNKLLCMLRGQLYHLIIIYYFILKCTIKINLIIIKCSSYEDL